MKLSSQAKALFGISWLLLVLPCVGADKGASNLSQSRTILFVDDHDILYRSGTKRVLQPLKRHPANPILPGAEKPWELDLAWTSIYRDPATGKYQLWYQAFSGKKSADKTRRCVVCYAESTNGIHFTKPNLGLFDYNGIKETSIVLVANGGFSDRYGVTVVVDLRDKDASRRYKMAHWDFTKDADGREYPGVNVAFSPDGIHWTKYPGGTLSRGSYSGYAASVPFADDTNRPWAIPRSMSDVANYRSNHNRSSPWDVPLSMADAVDAFYDPVRQVFAIYGKMWIDGPSGGMAWKHAMGRIESKDFIQWSKPQFVLAPDEHDPSWVEFHTSPVFFYNDIYFSPLQILDRATSGGVIDIELATSRDGLNWQRPFRKPFWLARATEKERFDSGDIFLGLQPIVLDDEIRFYYGGYAGGNATSGDSLLNKSGIGLATMPRDRFAGLQPVPLSDQPTLKKPLEKIGQVTLKPIALSGVKKLELNADASGGSIRVEVLNTEAKRVRGFSFDDATPLTGDSLRHPIRWKDRDVKDLSAGDYMLRIHLNNATVYALTIQK